MRCSRCGTELPDGARFCSSCGARSPGRGGGAQVRLRPVRRRRGLHRARRRRGSRGRPRPQPALLPRRRASGSNGTAATSRSTSAMRSWPCSARRSLGATTRSEPCARRSASSRPSAELNERAPRPRPPGARRRLHAARRSSPSTRRPSTRSPPATWSTRRPVSSPRRRPAAPSSARRHTASPVTRSTSGSSPAVDAKGKRDPVPAWLVERSLVAPAERTDVDDAARRSGARGAADPHRLGSRRRPRARRTSSPWSGPAGIGKSRLAEEVAARGRGARRAQPVGTEPAVRGADAVPRVRPDRAPGARASTRTTASTSPAQKLGDARRLASSPRPRRPMPRATSRCCSASASDEPASEAIHLLFATRRIVEHLAERRSAAAGVRGRALGGRLAARPDRLPDLARPRPPGRRSSRSLGRSSWRSGPRGAAGVVGQTTLTLEPLTAAEATEVVGTLLAGAAPVDGRAKVVATAEGNPLFLEELVAALADEAGDGRAAGDRAGRDRGADRRAAARCADRAAARLRDRAVVLERRARGDGRPRRRGRRRSRRSRRAAWSGDSRRARSRATWSSRSSTC